MSVLPSDIVVYGRRPSPIPDANSTGAVQSRTLTLSGQGGVTGSQSFERLFTPHSQARVRTDHWPISGWYPRGW